MRPLGLLTLALPLQSLGNLATDEPIVEEPEARPARTDLSRMLPMEVDVLVELCSLRMTLKRLKTLQPGDILPLGNRDALIRVNGLPMFEGEAGDPQRLPEHPRPPPNLVVSPRNRGAFLKRRGG